MTRKASKTMVGQCIGMDEAEFERDECGESQRTVWPGEIVSVMLQPLYDGIQDSRWRPRRGMVGK